MALPLSRGLFLAACLCSAGFDLAGLPAFSGRAEAGDKQPAPADYRLLVLGGRTVRWTVPDRGLPTTVTYAFLKTERSFPGARNCDAMLPAESAHAPSGIDSEGFRQETRAAFALWEAAANIVFKEVPEAEAGILIGADAKPRGRAFTNVALGKGAATERGTIAQSLICLNPQKRWKIGFDGDLEVYDLRYTLAHEIGHAIGLDHPSPEGQLMSFRYVEKSRGLTAGDVAGALALYGAKGDPAPAQPQRADAGTSTEQPQDQTFGIGERAAADAVKR